MSHIGIDGLEKVFLSHPIPHFVALRLATECDSDAVHLDIIRRCC